MMTPKKTTIWLAALSLVVIGLCWKNHRDSKNHRILSGFLQSFIGKAQLIEQSRANGLNGATPAATAQCLRNAVEFEYPDSSIRSLKPGSVGATYLASAPQSTHYYVTELQHIVARERAAAIQGLIAHLRATTGQDFGDDPQPWIKEFANKKYPRPRAKGVTIP
jgi:hypothetical protein